MQRLQAASAAIEQARTFLTADSAMLPLLQKTIAEAEAQAIALHGPPPSAPELGETDTEQAQADEEEDNPEPEASAQARKAQEADEHQDERRALLHTTGGGDDAAATRAQLQAFEERARLMRNAIAEGRGSFEWYYVKRRTLEAAEYLARDEPIPPGGAGVRGRPAALGAILALPLVGRRRAVQHRHGPHQAARSRAPGRAA